ncbi:MAG TPA: energy transducer TonB [Steroidobacteraceae bacterium]|nr:energy transducer TonB [Steroidobacteraceae bacterium]
MTTSTSSAASTPDPQRNSAADAPSVRPAADLTALTQSDDFLLELGPALRGLAAVRPVDNLQAALEGLRSAERPQLLVVDARAVDAAVSAVESAAVAAAGVPVLIFAPADDRTRYAQALRGSDPFALLTTPIDPATVHPVFVRAIAEAANARAGTSAATPADTATGGRRRWWMVGGVLLALLAVGAIAGAVYWRRAQQRAGLPASLVVRPKPAAARLAVELSIVQGRVDDLLEKARAAMRARRYTGPPDDNALLYYRSAAAADPSSGEARDGLRRIGAVLADRFATDLTAAHLNQAALALATLAAAIPDHPGLADDRRQLAAAQADRARALAAQQQADANAQHLASLVEDRIRSGELSGGPDSASAYAAQLASAAPQNPLTPSTLADLRAAQRAAADRAAAAARAKALAKNAARLLGLAQARLAAGRLLDPPQESAAYYLAQARAHGADAAALAPLNQALMGRLLARARTEALAGKQDERDLAAARALGADAKALAEIRNLQAVKAAQATSAGLASRLRLVRKSLPRYPSEALADDVSGTVVVAYRVDPRGRTRDVRVIEATPPGLFDRAAIDAVTHWRYAPTLVAGKAVAVPTRVKIRFVPTR